MPALVAAAGAPPGAELSPAQRLRTIEVATAGRRRRLGPLRRSSARPGFARAFERLLDELLEHGPASLGGVSVARTEPLTTNDGSKFFLADGSWLLVRSSGTEPLVRVYTEATSAELRDALVEAGEHLVRGA